MTGCCPSYGSATKSLGTISFGVGESEFSPRYLSETFDSRSSAGSNLSRHPLFLSSTTESCLVSRWPNKFTDTSYCSQALSAVLLPRQNLRPSLIVCQQGVSDVKLFAHVLSQALPFFKLINVFTALPCVISSPFLFGCF